MDPSTNPPQDPVGGDNGGMPQSPPPPVNPDPGAGGAPTPTEEPKPEGEGSAVPPAQV